MEMEINLLVRKSFGEMEKNCVIKLEHIEWGSFKGLSHLKIEEKYQNFNGFQHFLFKFFNCPF
jgi:hypothetical protein